MGSTTPPSVATPPRRPWYRLHRSTWVVLVLLAPVVFVLLFAGEFERPPHAYLRIAHGWPLTYLRGVDTPFAGYESSDPEWLDPLAWTFAGDPSLSMFALDALILALGAAVIASAVEWRRRWRAHALQFSLSEMAIVILVAAGLLAWCRSLINYCREEQAILGVTGLSIDPVYCGPHILRKVLGRQLTSAFEHDECTDKWLSEEETRCLAFPGHLQELETLILQNPSHLKDLPQWIETHPRIKSVSLYAHDVTAKDLASIGKLRHLTDLSLGNVKASDDAIPLLGDQDNLERLSLTWESPEYLYDTIRSLEEADNDVNELPAWTRAASRVLREVLNDASDWYGGDRAAEVIAKFHNLRELHLSCTRISDEGMARILRIQNLTRLSIDSPKVRFETVTPAEVTGILRELTLRNAAGIADDGVDRLSQLASLEFLYISDAKKVTHKGIRCLSRLPKLRQLNFHECNIDRDALIGIAAIKSLRVLKLYQSRKLRDDSMNVIATMGELEHLELGFTGITDVGLQELGRLTKLKYLRLYENPNISAADVAKLQQRLVNCQITHGN